MAHTGPFIPPGQSAPFATITTTDHSAWIIVSTALGLCMSLLFAAIRVFVHSATKHAYGNDDYILGAATLLATIQSIVLLSSCSNGLGKSGSVVSPQSVTVSEEKYYASNILFVVVMTLSRASVACFLLQLTPMPKQQRFMHILLVFTAVWGLVLSFTIALACDLPSPWIFAEERCGSYFLVWQAMESLGCVLEVAMFASALWLVWRLRTSRSNKMTVVIAFSFRLWIIAIVGLRLNSSVKDGLGADALIEESQFIAWTSAELHYSLVSATIPILRSFVSNLSTNYGAGQGPGGSTYGTGSMNSLNHSTVTGRIHHIPSQEFELTSIAGEASNILWRSSPGGLRQLADVAEVSRAYSPYMVKDTDAGSTGSNGSQKIIIRKDVAWRVQRKESKL